MRLQPQEDLYQHQKYYFSEFSFLSHKTDDNWYCPEADKHRRDAPHLQDYLTDRTQYSNYKYIQTLTKENCPLHSIYQQYGIQKPYLVFCLYTMVVMFLQR